MAKTLASGERMFATNATDVADEMIMEARLALGELEDAIRGLKMGITERKAGRGLPIAYCQRIIEKAVGVSIEVSRANGAILVRGTE